MEWVQLRDNHTSNSMYLCLTYIIVFTRMQDKFFPPLKLALQFAYEMTDQITLNQTTHIQTMACLTKLSCEICALQRY
jgi:hypothetical protein